MRPLAFVSVLTLLACSKASLENPAPTAVTSTTAPATVKPAALPPPVVKLLEVAPGTEVRVRMLQSVSTKSARAGDVVSATLASPLYAASGNVLAPVGSNAQLLVASSDEGGRVKGRAVLGLRLQSIHLQSGRALPVQSNVYLQEARGTKKRDAATIGVLSGIGAAVGAIADRGKGAAIGAASGGGAGTGIVLATRGEQVQIPAESLITFRTTQRAVVN